MAAVTSAPKPFSLCELDGGIPARFVGERDFFSWPPTEEFSFDVDGRDSHGGLRVGLSSHRLIWQAAAFGNVWLALHLDQLTGAEVWSAFMRSRRCLLKLRSGALLYIKFKTDSIVDDVVGRVQKALSEEGWRAGSYEVASMGGLQKILGSQAAKQKATGESLDVALADLESLRKHASLAATAARQVAMQLARGEAAYPDMAGEGTGGSSVGNLLEEFGLLQADGTPISTRGGKGHRDITADVQKVCQAALEKKGGMAMLLAHDVFCLVNRARGMALVSPEEVMQALRSCSAQGGALRLRKLGSTGALAVCLAKTSDTALDDQLVRMAEADPVSAHGLASELNITAAEARYLLQDAEGRGILVRDDAPECVYFYRNFFDDV